MLDLGFASVIVDGVLHPLTRIGGSYGKGIENHQCAFLGIGINANVGRVVAIQLKSH